MELRRLHREAVRQHRICRLEHELDMEHPDVDGTVWGAHTEGRDGRCAQCVAAEDRLTAATERLRERQINIFLAICVVLLLIGCLYPPFTLVVWILPIVLYTVREQFLVGDPSM